MSDKPVAFFVTALVAAPICSVCILGPAAVGGFIAGWFTGLGPLAVGAGAVAGIVAFVLYRRNRQSEKLSEQSNWSSK